MGHWKIHIARHILDKLKENCCSQIFEHRRVDYINTSTYRICFSQTALLSHPQRYFVGDAQFFIYSTSVIIWEYTFHLCNLSSTRPTTLFIYFLIVFICRKAVRSNNFNFNFNDWSWLAIWYGVSVSRHFTLRPYDPDLPKSFAAFTISFLTFSSPSVRPFFITSFVPLSPSSMPYLSQKRTLPLYHSPALPLSHLVILICHC